MTAGIFSERRPCTPKPPRSRSRPTRNTKLLNWVAEMARSPSPERIHWCDGSEEEYDRLCGELVKAGTFRRSNEKLRPNCYLALVRPLGRGARRGPHLHLLAAQGRRRPHQQLGRPGARCARRSTGSSTAACAGAPCTWCPSAWARSARHIAHIGVEISDSRLRGGQHELMTRMGAAVLARAGRRRRFRALPALGRRARCRRARRTCAWPCNTATSTSCTSPRARRSGPSAPATAATRCWARSAWRCASPRSWDASEGWLAEHMLILGVESPEGEKHYVTAAFPSACGKTNFAMLIPPPAFKGWKVTTIGDDIAWIKPGADGRLHAINPEAGFFGVAPGTGLRHQPELHGSHQDQHHLHQRGAHARRRRVVGGHDRRSRPRSSSTGPGKRMDARLRQRRRRIPTARFTVAATQCPRSTRPGTTPMACPSPRSSSAAGAPPPCRW